MEAITLFDYVVIAVILLSMAMAFLKGFTTVALSLAAWIGALVVTSLGFSVVQPFARDLVETPELADFASLAVLFLVSLIIFKILAGKIGKAMREGPVGFLDRSLGALFGLVRGLVLVSILFIGIKALVGDDLPDYVKNAKTRPLVAWGAFMVESLTEEALGQIERNDPEGFDAVQKEIQSIQQQLENLPDRMARQQLEEKLKELEEEARKKRSGDGDQTT